MRGSERGACSTKSRTEQTDERGAMTSRSRGGRPAKRPVVHVRAALQLVTEALLDRKAVDPLVLDLRGLSAATDYFVIVSGTSDTHVRGDRKSTRLNSSHSQISYAVFCLKKKKNMRRQPRRKRPTDAT